MSFDFTSLITDRTQEDADRVRALSEKGWEDMTSEEKNEWSGEMKGAYNASDLNRVIGAVNYLAGVFQSYGYAPGIDAQESNWAVGQVPTQSQMQTYLGNIQALMDTLAEAQFAPELPQSMALLSYVGANSIEQILVELDAYLTAMSGVYLRAGMPWAVAGNEVYVAND